MNDQSKGLEFVSFRIGTQEFCIDIMAVREIRGWTPTTSIPHSPDFVRGVVNLRGVVLPVVDLALRLGKAPSEPTARHAIIVTKIKDNFVGLLVDAVTGVISAQSSMIQPTPEVSSDIAQSFVKGVLPLEDRMIALLQPDALLPTSFHQAA